MEPNPMIQSPTNICQYAMHLACTIRQIYISIYRHPWTWLIQRRISHHPMIYSSCAHVMKHAYMFACLDCLLWGFLFIIIINFVCVYKRVLEEPRLPLFNGQTVLINNISPSFIKRQFLLLNKVGTVTYSSCDLG